jgi:hypothetical protein
MLKAKATREASYGRDWRPIERLADLLNGLDLVIPQCWRDPDHRQDRDRRRQDQARQGAASPS